jgi:hypothetical protein
MAAPGTARTELAIGLHHFQAFRKTEATITGKGLGGLTADRSRGTVRLPGRCGEILGLNRHGLN